MSHENKWEQVKKWILDYNGWELTVEPGESIWKWSAVWNGHQGRETRTVSWYAETRQEAQRAAIAAVHARER